MKLDYGKVSAIGISGCDNTLLISGAAWADLRHRPVDLGESTWSSKHFEYTLKLYLALWLKSNASRSIRYTVESGCYDSIDFGSSLTSWRYLSSTEKLLDHPSQFLIWPSAPAMLVRPVLLPSAGIWDTWALWGQCLRILFEVLRHCEDNAYVPYLRYSGIVWTMPTYLPWPLGIWSGSPLCDLYICGRQLTFGYCSKRTTLALWLFMAGHWLWGRTDLLSMRDISTLWGQCLRILSYSITRYLIWGTTLWPLSLRLIADVWLL